MRTFDGELNISTTLDGELEAGLTFDGQMGIIQKVHDADIYEGDYIVIPKANDATVLETRDKMMTDNVTVTKVPFYETHSETGTTVYIASEV